jgi:integrase
VSVRKRIWTSGGERREAWVVDYTSLGNRHIRTFDKKKDADAFHASVRVDVAQGTHTAPSRSPTVAEAGKLWVESAVNAQLERSTVDQYRQHLEHHIVPFIGPVKLAQLSVPSVHAFADRLAHEGRSPAMVRKIIRSLGSILTEVQRRGLVAQNVVRSLGQSRRKGDATGRHRNGKLKIGVDIPSPDEIKRLIAALQDHHRPLLLTAIFTGLRSSELRGLRWHDVDLKHGRLHVRQRADRYGSIGQPKSAAGERTVPLPPVVNNTLREWKLACPKGDLGLVFPGPNGAPEHRLSIIKQAFHPAQIAASIVDREGQAKYGGLHALRHFYASWCINRRADGGLELPLKVVQARLGHASIQMTADRYGHLFPSTDDGAELAAAEKAFLS